VTGERAERPSWAAKTEAAGPRPATLRQLHLCPIRDLGARLLSAVLQACTSRRGGPEGHLSRARGRAIRRDGPSDPFVQQLRSNLDGQIRERLAYLRDCEERRRTGVGVDGMTIEGPAPSAARRPALIRFPDRGTSDARGVVSAYLSRGQQADAGIAPGSQQRSITCNSRWSIRRLL